MKIRRRTSEPRDSLLTIRISDSEKELLKAAALAAGVSMGAYLLLMAGIPSDNGNEPEAENRPFPGQTRIAGA